MNTGDRKIIGSRMKFDAPMTDSVRRSVSPIAFDSAPNGTASSTLLTISTSSPTMPPSKRAPSMTPRISTIAVCTTRMMLI